MNESSEHFWEIRASQLSNQILNDKYEQMRTLYEKGRTRRLVVHIQYRQKVNHLRDIITALRKEIAILSGNDTLTCSNLPEHDDIPLVGFDDLVSYNSESLPAQN